MVTELQLTLSLEPTIRSILASRGIRIDSMTLGAVIDMRVTVLDAVTQADINALQAAIKTATGLEPTITQRTL